MTVSVKGLVFSKKNMSSFEALDKIKSGIESFFMDKLAESIKKEHPEDHMHRMKTIINLSDKEQEKFSYPEIEYKGYGLFNVRLSFPSEFKKEGYESRKISVLVDLEEEDEYVNARYIGVPADEIKEMKDFKLRVWLSLDMSGSASEIVIAILKKFGNDYPSYLIRNDSTDAFDKDCKNVVKVGSFIDNISSVSIGEQEYKDLRSEEIKSLI